MRLAILSFIAMSFASLSANAEEPQAVILDVVGDTTPAVEAFDELPAGTKLTLSPGAVVQLGHYATCAEVTVEGGTIAIEAERVMFDGNKSVTQDGETCVSNVTLAVADLVSASIVTRSVVSGLPQIAPKPAVAVAGPDADGYTTLFVIAGGKTVMTTDIVDRRAQVPADAEALVPGQTVTLVVKGPDVRQRAARAEVAEDAAGWVVLRQ